MNFLERVIASAESLGGVSRLKDIYFVYKQITNPEDISSSVESVIRARIEENSKDSDVFKGEDIFRSLYGKGKGVWYLKNNFRNIEEAKFIYEFKEKNLKLWEEISKKKFHTNDYVRKITKIHRGERGIYRDLNKTKKLSFTDGLCQSVLDTAEKYDDILTDTHLTYHYPTTTHVTRDEGEINSLKLSHKYNIPIFVVLGLGKDKSKKEIRLGYVQSYNDSQKSFLIEFKIEKKQIVIPKEEIIEIQTTDEKKLELFNSNRKRKTTTSSTRGNNQPKFSSDLFKYYENKCAVCDISYFLDAAHIIPVKHNGIDHKLNGLILCKNHHKAFDDGFFKINYETLNIEIIKGNKDLLKIPRDDIKHLTNKPGKKYLEWRYNKYK